MIPENSILEIARLSRLHATLIFTLLAVCGGGGIWALLGAWRGHGPSERLQVILWIAELLLAAEFLLGIALWSQGLRPARPEVHLIYGLVAIAAIPFGLALTRDQPPRRARATLGILCVFLCAILLRGLETARL